MRLNFIRGILLPTLIVTFLVASAHRSPAPVIEETPPPEKTSTPVAKHSKSKGRTDADANTNEASASSAEEKHRAARSLSFSGDWAGTIAQGVWGNVAYHFIVNAAGTSVTERSRLGNDTQPASWNGKFLAWRSGVFLKEISWTLTPNNDGRTAAVACSSPFYGNPSATFRKVSP